MEYTVKTYTAPMSDTSAKDALLKYYLTLNEKCPFRPVDWRWRLCEFLVTHPEFKKPKLDPITSETFKFVKLLNTLLETDDDIVQIIHKIPQKKFGNIFSAWQYGVFGKQSEQVIDLQCLILASAPQDLILRVSQLNNESYQYYIALFYDVLTELKNPSYILHQAVFKDDQSYNLYDTNNLDRFLAYLCGADAVYYRRFRQRKGLNTLFEFKDDFRPNINKLVLEDILVKFWVAAQDDKTELAMLHKIYSSLQTIEIGKEGFGTLLDTFKDVLGQDVRIRKLDSTELQEDLEVRKQLSETIFQTAGKPNG